jgi:hypothetical protein
MEQSAKKDNVFVVNLQIIKDGQLHEIKPVTVTTKKSSPKSFYNQIKNDHTDAYNKLYPNAAISIVSLP